MNPVKFARQIVRFQKDSLDISNTAVAFFEDQAESLVTSLMPMDDHGAAKTLFKSYRESRDLLKRNLETAYELQESLLAAFDNEFLP